MARVRAAIDEKLVDFGTVETTKLAKLLDTKLAEQPSTFDDLSKEFTSVVKNAFADIPATAGSNSAEQLDSIKEYVENAVKLINENK